jgi:hypothetical protein
MSKRMNARKALMVGALLPLLYLADVSPQASGGLSLVREAHAIVGAPVTPVSVAGVARRTTRRTVAAGAAAGAAATPAPAPAAAAQPAAPVKPPPAGAQPQAAAAPAQPAPAQQPAAPRPAGAPAAGAVVNTLPAGCVAEAKDGVEYQKCGGVSYRSAFQGNNLVYVAQ